MYLLFDALAARNFELILAEQSYTKVYQYRYPNKQTTLVRNYASNQLFKNFINTNREAKNNRINLFYMGSIDEQYCCKQMLEALAILNKNGIDANLKMVGWIDRAEGGKQITVPELPSREQIDIPVREQLIVELYSK